MLKCMEKKIHFLVMDVDGTLTNGKIYMGNDGEVFKAFDIKDGLGIHDILPRVGVIPIIITGRTSKILENRCNELGISTFYQGVVDKVGVLKQILDNYSLKDGVTYDYGHVAYIGDDLNDLKVMKMIQEQGGVVGCPSDAVLDVKTVADFLSSYEGGNGAVREFIEWIIT